MSYALAAAKELGVRDKFALFDGAITDDHVPFALLGIRSIDIIDFEFGSEPGLNNYWHTPADTIDKLSALSLEAVGKVVIGMLNRVAEECAR